MAAGYFLATGRGQGVMVHVDSGTANAAMASFFAILTGLVAMIAYLEHEKSHLRIRVEQWPPRLALWGGILKIGASRSVLVTRHSVTLGSSSNRSDWMTSAGRGLP